MSHSLAKIFTVKERMKKSNLSMNEKIFKNDKYEDFNNFGELSKSIR